MEVKNVIRNVKSYEELEFSDDFMFKRVMMDPEISRGVLERILGVRIDRVEYPEMDKQIDTAYEVRGIRMDVYLKDDNTRYDIEMQTKPKKAIGRRSRYYQSSVDMDAIDKGEDFLDLKDSMIIFICTFDPFGRKRHLYSFKTMCEQDAAVDLDDGTVKIILNTKGTMDDVSPEMIRFLKFVENMNSVRTDDDELLARIRKRILTERISKEGRQEYTMFQMYYNDTLREGREEGREEGEMCKLISLVCKKLQKHKTIEVIAEELEEDVTAIQKIVDAAQKCAPDYDTDAVYRVLTESSEKS